MSKLSNFKYYFIITGIAAVFLIVFGIILMFNKSSAHQIIAYLVALIIGTFALVRLIPLIKQLDNKKRILVSLIEIIVNIIVSIIIFLIATKLDNNTYRNIFVWLLILVLGARGIIYFIDVVYLNGKKDVVKSIIHIGLYSLACSMLTLTIVGKFSLESIRYFAIALSLLFGIFFIRSTYKAFNQYRINYNNDNSYREYIKDNEDHYQNDNYNDSHNDNDDYKDNEFEEDDKKDIIPEYDDYSDDKYVD